MGLEQVLGLAGQFGPMGLFVAYLMWREQRNDKWLQRHEENRLKTENATSDANQSLAASLGALTAVIQRLDR